MRLMKTLKTLKFAALLGTFVFLASSCSDDDESIKIDYGTISGIVTDEAASPISDVTVTISGMEGSVTTGSDGKYTFTDVSMESHYVEFKKKGYQPLSATVVAKKFNENKMATIDVSLIYANSKIAGTILDAGNGNKPLAGVTVTVNKESVTTEEDGTYLFESLSLDDYTVKFTKENYPEIKKTIKKNNFINEVATLNVKMGGPELLRGLYIDNLESADKWYYNEYRGGGNGDAYPHWDWSTDYMCAFSFEGAWEEQWEGTTLQIRNSTSEQKNPADLNVFDSFVYGSKKITADNKILSLRVRTHNADATAPAYFGVQVIDLSQSTPSAVKIGETKTYGSEAYTDFDFDLSAYVGKEVIIAIGIYRKETGDYWKQLVLRAIRFADRKVENWDWLPGTEVIEDWKLTHEMVRSTMPHLKNSFTGISEITGGRDVNMSTGYPAAYRAWREFSHIANEWALVPLHKDPEIFPSEGYLIKTRGGGAANTKVPEAYFYAKFAIAAGNNQLTLRTRNFSSDYTFFKLTAITEDGVVEHIQPRSNTAQDASAAADGCWKFKHEAGSKGNADAYASFVYDLSKFNGKNVVLVFGVYNGEVNGTENKLAFYSVDLN